MPFPSSGRAARNLSAAAMSALLLASAGKHFRSPGFYRQVVPDWLCRQDAAAGDAAAPANRAYAAFSREEWIAVSGLLEAAAAVGILVPATRRTTATALSVLFTAFLAGHIDALRHAFGPEGTPRQQRIHTARLPLQAPLIAWAWSLRAAGPGSRR